ncbi:hypothetical protein [Cytobacillus oceanisediminis]|uniref:hypothetical protein n=1 Tax=Cytobacillus oceanisediminis TaxID=665099 RepID=UPI00207A0983|nr:hypothetical protein [Cytobacillus oceanisediminis]USK44914.1 hypothetical protein LIT27_03295 [Cytobacillus oceanisediminis]
MSRSIKISCFVFLLFLMTGCSHSDSDPVTSEKADSTEESNLKNFKTDDGKIEIVTFNKGNFSEDALKAIKEETLDYYNHLQKKNISIPSPSKIYLHLYKEEKVSYSSGNTIHLYWVKDGDYPLVHELTHVLFGHNHDHVTQEGLAIFMQDSYSDEKVFPNYKGDIHGIMNYLMMQEVMLPLETLLQKDEIFSYLNPNKDSHSLRWLAYIESASFSSFLIHEYGIESFLKIYDKPNLTNEIHTVYGKKLELLEDEWKEFVQEKPVLNEELIHRNDSQLPEIINHLELNKSELLKPL